MASRIKGCGSIKKIRMNLVLKISLQSNNQTRHQKNHENRIGNKSAGNLLALSHKKISVEAALLNT